MKSARCAIAFLTVAVIVIAGGASADAQGQPAAVSRVQIAYEPPANPQFGPIYEALKKRQVLERLQGFLAPLRLPKSLTIRVAQCGAETQPYQSGGPVTVCYELVQQIIAIAMRKAGSQSEQQEITYGTFVEAVLHDLAYAIFDQLQVPIWGREDDAADRLAAFTMTQFGDKVALTTILGTTKFFEYSNHTWTGADFAAESSPEAQRFYNYLCIAYGGDPITFAFLNPPGQPLGPRILPDERAARCGGEYLQVQHAFNLRIMPYVDADLLIKVRASQWLMPDELPESAQ